MTTKGQGSNDIERERKWGKKMETLCVRPRYKNEVAKNAGCALSDHGFLSLGHPQVNADTLNA